MRDVILGTTGIKVPQNGFGALPIQRATDEEATRILRRAYEGGMRYFDTARAYTDSERKIGNAFDLSHEDFRSKIIIATKTMGRTPEKFWEDLETSLQELKTDYIDVYQFHMVSECYRPGDGSGMYEAMEEAKAQGKIRHIAITTHKLPVAMEIAESGLYEVLQFPFSYLSSEKDIELVHACKKNNVGFVAMKSLAGGLINKSNVAMAFLQDFDNVIPIWGIQRMSELEEWLSFMSETPLLTEEIRSFISKEKEELAGEFCRGCGYCMPCPMGIQINNCARMSLMLRRAPSQGWLSPAMQEEMRKIEDCVNCRQCTTKCPYELDTPELLRKNYEDYKKVLSGEVSVQ